MPAVWLQPLAHEEHEGSNITDATVCFLARDYEQVQIAFPELAGESRRPRTLINLRHPAIKALWWLARQLPPTCGDMTEYLIFLATSVDTTISAADAQSAIGFLASVNAGGGWDKDAMLGGRAALSLEAMKRQQRTPTKRRPGCRRSLCSMFCGINGSAVASGHRYGDWMRF